MNPIKEPQPTVLVADDDDAMRLLITTALRQADFSVVTVGDGTSAIDSFINRRPDLILLDVEMPGINGYQACQEIRQRPRGHNVPIVMVTGLEDTGSVNRAYEAGATDFITKPINWPLFGHRLRYILRAAKNVQALAASESKNRALLEAIPDRIFVVRHDGTVQHYLSGVKTSADTTAKDIVGHNINELMPAKTAARAYACILATLSTGKSQSFEHEHSLPPGPKRYYESRCVRHDAQHVLVIVRDISERKQAEAKIHHLAYYDSLTGLPNRQLFSQHLAEAIADACRHNEMLATLYIDLDRFKRINDTLGHTVGDAFLKSVARRLTASVCEAETVTQIEPQSTELEVARFGGDEFTILLTQLASDDDAIVVAQRIQNTLSEPFNYYGYEFVVTPSIGISIYPRHGEDTDSLLKNADTAMYQAKAAGRNNTKMYSSTMNLGAAERLVLENELRHALENDELEMYYQPKFGIQDLKIVGAEALLRWFHPERGEIPPATFIPLAEETGLIVDVDRWVADAVCQQLSAWRRFGIVAVPIAINLSGHEFCHGDPVQMITNAVEKAAVDPANLELEITETVLMRDVDRATKSLTALKDFGVGLSVDDFGTGYSSLSYLKRFPLDALKIDRAFVRDVNRDPDDAAICTAIIALAHSLSLKVIAEGVQNDAQLEFLRGEGCDQVQGFLLGEPVEADGLAELIKDERRINADGAVGAVAVPLRGTLPKRPSNQELRSFRAHAALLGRAVQLHEPAEQKKT